MHRKTIIFIPKCYVVIVLGLIFSLSQIYAQSSSEPFSDKDLITVENMANLLSDSLIEKPLIIHVGAYFQFKNGHIPGAVYTGMASTSKGIEILRKEVKELPHNKNIILYCGCCPWKDCPNIRPAFKTIQKMGFTNVKVLYISKNFQQDWIDKKLPVER